MSGIYLWDLIRWGGEWPIDLDGVVSLLRRADEILPGGRHCTSPLTPKQIAALDPESKLSLCEADSTMEIYLWDVFVLAVGWPREPKVIRELIVKADRIFPDGRHHKEPLTEKEIEALGFDPKKLMEYAASDPIVTDPCPPECRLRPSA
jgi:hypothetical protein